ncbi:MAG: peroxiredoxin [Gammaproteobacteria bacterium]|nr:peroxiredoxin [Gammaproteobacteria bacterium]
MTIGPGDRIPDVTVQVMGEKGPESVSSASLFAGRKVVMFGLPGAFTPTCSAAHLPGYVVKADEFFARGVDTIICISVNDAFVMDAWGKAQNAETILMVADGAAALTRAMGLDVDMTERGFGVRSERYAMIVEDGVVKLLNREAPRKFEVSDADTIPAAL